MKKSRFKIQNFQFLFCILHFAFCIGILNAQSTDQNFPTAVTTNQINGTIRARDIGDSRLTTYFYVFGGGQGDIFINVVTKNFDGDIDVFTLNGLKPLTKIKVFSDTADNETGRIIYLRQADKLILRVEGRSPNDEPATFQIKFAGSFLAEKPSNETETTATPQVKTENEGEVRVNSVGTIIEIKPKPTPKPIETPAKTEKQEEAKVAEQTEAAKELETVKKEEAKPVETKEEKSSLVVVITDDLEKPKEEKAEEVSKKEAATKVEENKTEETSKKETEAETEKNETEKVANPLEKIKLTVTFKDGTKIERPMSEILNVNVDKGILTIIQKDGTIGRYSILDIVEFTIK